MTATGAPPPDGRLTIVPANEASWDDLVAIFGTADYPGRCQCQRFKVAGWIWRDSTQQERTEMLRGQNACGDPGVTGGLLVRLGAAPEVRLRPHPGTGDRPGRVAGSQRFPAGSGRTRGRVTGRAGCRDGATPVRRGPPGRGGRPGQ